MEKETLIKLIKKISENSKTCAKLLVNTDTSYSNQLFYEANAYDNVVMILEDEKYAELLLTMVNKRG